MKIKSSFASKISIKGVSMIELLIVVAVLVSSAVAILALSAASIKKSTSTKEFVQATFFAQGALEGARNFRDGSSWNTDGLGTFITNASYRLQKSSDNPPRWQLLQGEEGIAVFTRRIFFDNALRDANNNIVDSQGTSDPETKKATARVLWKGRQVELITYLTNWR